MTFCLDVVLTGDSPVLNPPAATLLHSNLMEPLAPTLRSIAADWLKKSDPAAVPVVLWPMVCGESVAARTSAKSFADGELKIAVPDRQWADQLREFVPRYLAAINEVAPAKVKMITFEAPAGK
jgi:hypothetical protein